mgnify:CR=1 FL=1
MVRGIWLFFPQRPLRYARRTPKGAPHLTPPPQVFQALQVLQVFQVFQVFRVFQALQVFRFREDFTRKRSDMPSAKENTD